MAAVAGVDDDGTDLAEKRRGGGPRRDAQRLAHHRLGGAARRRREARGDQANETARAAALGATGQRQDARQRQ